MFPKQLTLAAVARVAGLSLSPVVSGIEAELYEHVRYVLLDLVPAACRA